MRRWLLPMMIVLLLLRGWASEAAAMPAAPVPDCAEHSQSAVHHDMATQDGEPATSACASCPLLWSLAPALDAGASDGTSFQPPRPESAPARFASAERGRRFKPPIS